MSYVPRAKDLTGVCGDGTASGCCRLIPTEAMTFARSVHRGQNAGLPFCQNPDRATLFAIFYCFVVLF